MFLNNRETKLNGKSGNVTVLGQQSYTAMFWCTEKDTG